MSNINYQERIPNNVDLSNDRRLQRALEAWQPDYLEWWMDMGPEGYQDDDIYLRTAVSVDQDGWASFDYVKMPDYRWGIFLTPFEGERKVNFGDHMGEDAWQSVPGEYRNILRRVIVTQGDTEPASVEQQRLLGHTCPSLYDLRNLFQVNVEEGRHLWAMVYLLHRYFGRDGREEAEELLERRSGDEDSPRILGAFNEPCSDWLNFFCFTTFTDRDGKYQLRALSESGFDPLARTCSFMLTEEAHHMFVGQSGVARILKRTAERMKEGDPRKLGVIPLDMIQRHVNLWYALSLDLFGGEDSSNAANFFAAGLKGRDQEMRKYDDHLALDQTYDLTLFNPQGEQRIETIPLRRAMNEVLRDAYIEDCEKVVNTWNRVLRKEGCDERITLPNRRFFRHQGIYAGMYFDPQGNWMAPEDWEAKRDEWLPSMADKSYIHSLMKPCTEPGQYADWISPPPRGINGQPIDYHYVEFAGS